MAETTMAESTIAELVYGRISIWTNWFMAESSRKLCDRHDDINYVPDHTCITDCN
jgi:hypothetical protein